MSINALTGVSNTRFNNFKTSPNITGKYYTDRNKNADDRLSKSAKSGIFMTTALSVGTALAFISKKQGFSIKPKDILKTNPKDWAVFKIYTKKHPYAKTLKIEEPEILTLAGASVAGGLTGGAIFDDKKHLKAKARESVNQMLGNVAIPVACVGGASRLYKKYEKNIMRYVPEIEYDKYNRLSWKCLDKLSLRNSIKLDKALQTTVKYTNKFLKAVPPVSATAISLAAGIIGGNRFSNFLNEKVFHKKVERKIKTTDFAPHVDDLCIAITLMSDKSPVSSVITRTIPVFLCVPGMEVGKHR